MKQGEEKNQAYWFPLNQFPFAPWDQISRNESLLVLLQIQYRCNLELQRNQKLIEEYTKGFQTKIDEKKGSSQTSNSTKNKQPQPATMKYHMREGKESKKKKKLHGLKSIKDSSQYEPEQNDQPEAALGYKISESKNIPKSFGKSIVAFIRKNATTTNYILEMIGIDANDFDEALQGYKGKINTIHQLRSLWIEQKNPYAKALRILSNMYMKKHCLEHIFNSRIENHGKHLKYRAKVLEGIQNPENFTHMKDY